MASHEAATRSAEQPMLDGMEPDAADELGFRGPRCAGSSGSRTASSTTGPAPTSCARRSPTRRAAAPSAGTRTSDLVRLKVVKSLLDAGVKLQTARKAIEYLRDDLGEDWATASLVLDGTNSVLARTDDMLVDLVRHGQGVLNIVPLASRGGGARRRVVAPSTVADASAQAAEGG